MTDIEYKSVKYSEEDKKEMFPLQKEEEISIVVIDSANLNNGTVFDTEDDKIINYINTQKSRGKFGKLFDFVITKKGKIYKISPDGLSSNVLEFDLYSENISYLLPKYCPQTDGKVIPHTVVPDVAGITILLECDSDESTNVDNGQISEATEQTLEDLLAYYIKNYDVKIKHIIQRNRFPKLETEQKLIGPSMYKSNAVGFVLLTSYALAIERNNTRISLVCNDEPIEFSK